MVLIITSMTIKKVKSRVNEIVQWVRVLSAKDDDLSSIPGAPPYGRKREPTVGGYPDLHICTKVTHTHIHKHDG